MNLIIRLAMCGYVILIVAIIIVIIISPLEPAVDVITIRMTWSQWLVNLTMSLFVVWKENFIHRGNTEQGIKGFLSQFPPIIVIWHKCQWHDQRRHKRTTIVYQLGRSKISAFKAYTEPSLLHIFWQNYSANWHNSIQGPKISAGARSKGIYTISRNY